MELGLQGKVAVVTGAGGGIGRELAKGLASVGCRVVVCDINPDTAQATLQQLEGDHCSLVTDLSKVANCKRVVEDTVGRYGRLDILVNAAGILRRVAIDDVEEELWEQIINANLKSLFFLSKEACRVMKKNGRGRIINFSSQGAFTGGLSQSAVYNMTKGAIITLTKSFASTYAQDGIMVNAVAPGMVDTEMMRLPPKDLDSLIQKIPLKRLAAPAELVGTVLFLASDWASYITGATVDVTGGQLMR